jgi:hypothetical protein
MLFDLRGKRRRTVQGVYLALAILMGAGLVFFGIGSSVSGGLGDLFSGGGGGDSTAEETVQKNINAAEKKLSTNPNDREALADLVRGHYQLATTTADTSTGQFGEEARGELEAATDAWQRYLDAVEKPEAGLANTAIQSYSGLALLEQEPQDQKPFWEGASEAAESLTLKSKNPAPYVQLVQYASLAGQTRKADLAGERAIELAPKDQKKEVEAAVEQAKQVGAQQLQPTPQG